MESVRKYIRVDRKEINYLKFIFEGYDGLASLTTIDPAFGIVLLCIAPGCIKDVNMVLRDLEGDIMIEPVNDTDIKDLQ